MRILDIASTSFFNAQTFINISDMVGFPTKHPVLPKRVVNHRPHTSFTWAELRAADKGLAGALQHKAREYGFPESCLSDSKEFFEETLPMDPDTLVTVEDDGNMLWFWDRTDAQRLFQPAKLFKTVKSARQHANSIASFHRDKLDRE